MSPRKQSTATAHTTESRKLNRDVLSANRESAVMKPKDDIYTCRYTFENLVAKAPLMTWIGAKLFICGLVLIIAFYVLNIPLLTFIFSILLGFILLSIMVPSILQQVVQTLFSHFSKMPTVPHVPGRVVYFTAKKVPSVLEDTPAMEHRAISPEECSHDSCDSDEYDTENSIHSSQSSSYTYDDHIATDAESVYDSADDGDTSVVETATQNTQATPARGQAVSRSMKEPEGCDQVHDVDSVTTNTIQDTVKSTTLKSTIPKTPDPSNAKRTVSKQSKTNHSSPMKRSRSHVSTKSMSPNTIATSKKTVVSNTEHSKGPRAKRQKSIPSQSTASATRRYVTDSGRQHDAVNIDPAQGTSSHRDRYAVQSLKDGAVEDNSSAIIVESHSNSIKGEMDSEPNSAKEIENTKLFQATTQELNLTSRKTSTNKAATKTTQQAPIVVGSGHM